MEPRTVSTSSLGISARNREGREARSCCSFPKMRRYTARVSVSDFRARVMPTYTSRRSSSMPFSSFKARLCGEMPSSMPVRKTWSNSRPLVLCSVITVTPGLPSNVSASLTRAAASKKTEKDSPFSIPSATARTSSSRFSMPATSSVVFGMDRMEPMRQGVFPFRAIVKAETAHELVTKPAPAEHFFKCARLKIGPIFHGAGLRGVFIENALEFAGDNLSFCVGVSSLEIPQVGASSVFCAERLAKAFRIVGDDRAGGVQDLLRRAVISLQLDNARRSVVA